MEKSKPLISIICPVYNAEKTIVNMINSVLSQTYSRLELIIVDDVSSDRTPQIIEDAAKNDDRIVFIKNSSNTGPGPAKNLAIKNATGDYITFIDGDDWIEPSAYEELLNAISSVDADVAVMGYSQDFLDKNDKLKYSVKILPPDLSGNGNAAETVVLLDCAKVFSFCWNKLFRASIIKDTFVEFPPIMHSEDFFFNTALLPYIKKTAVLKKSLYHYIKPQKETLTTSKHIKGFYELSNNRYNAIKGYCVSQGLFAGKVCMLSANTHLKHLMMCLIYNADKASSMTHRQRILFAKKMLEDENTKEAIKNSSPNSRASKIIAMVFKTKRPLLLVTAGRVFYFFQNRLSEIFNKLK